MVAFKVPQIKKPAKITQAARAQARMQPTRTAAVFVYNPHLRYISQNLHGRKKLFPEKKKQLFRCVNVSTSQKHFLQLYPHVTDLLQSDLSSSSRFLLGKNTLFSPPCLCCLLLHPQSMQSFLLDSDQILPSLQ